MKHLAILGSTGSIGCQTLEVVDKFPAQFNVVGLTGHRNITKLKEQILTYHPDIVAVSNTSDALDLEGFIKRKALLTQVVVGSDGLISVATYAKNDFLVVAIVGTTAIKPTYEAIKKKIPIGLACKEVLVSAGELIMSLAMQLKVPVVPIDSEHAAIHQCLNGYYTQTTEIVSKLTLTASGGPFWNRELDTFHLIKKEDALKHPNWTMGGKITIDSATMMNKGLEVIEAFHLFQTPYEDIEVVIHPQSIVHSLVEFKDGNVMAQLGCPDMHVPIQYALTFPEKWESPWPRLSLVKSPALQFCEPDFVKFPLLQLAFDTGKQGGSAPIVMNAANEAVVLQFLQDKCAFSDIAPMIERSVLSYQHHPVTDIEEIVQLDASIKAKINQEFDL